MVLCHHTIKGEFRLSTLFLDQQPHSQLVTWSPAFWLPEHYTWSSHPWWLQCVTTSRSCANNTNYEICLELIYMQCWWNSCFSIDLVELSQVTSVFISLTRLVSSLNTWILNDDKPLAVRHFWWLFGSTNWFYQPSCNWCCISYL